MADPRVERLRQRLRLPIVVLAAVIVAGTLGYAALWWGTANVWLDAVYMTIITITTVGYGEVRPLGPVGRVFTMFLALTGVWVSPTLDGGAGAWSSGSRRSSGT